MRFVNRMYNNAFKALVDRSEKKEELEKMIKEILIYTHNLSRAGGSPCVDTTELQKIFGIDILTMTIQKNKFKSNLEFYETVKRYYDEIERRKEQHLKEGFDWNHDPFENWTAEDWENY